MTRYAIYHAARDKYLRTKGWTQHSMHVWIDPRSGIASAVEYAHLIAKQRRSKK